MGTVPDTPVCFQLLGAVQAQIAGRSIDLGPARQQCVLVALVLAADQVVPVDQLVDRVWNGGPASRASLYSYVSRLRGLLVGTREVEIVRQSGGYRLAVDPMAVDVHRFRQLTEAARRTGDAEQAALGYTEALGLWRGDAFAGLDTAWLVAERAALHEERRIAIWERTELLLGMGRHLEILTELAAGAAEYPLDERLACQLMLALHQAGQRAKALGVYQDLRCALVDELGLEPGAEAQEMHRRILSGDADGERAGDRTTATAAAAQVPRELPADISPFTGREPELTRLHDLVRGHGITASPTVVATIDGTAGIGKTSLAVHFAHQVVDRFPDGQLYLDLRGSAATSPMTAVAALGRLLRSLGVSAGRVPTDEAERAAQYRSILATRRMLIVLDDARTVEQIGPLLPGGTGCLTVVTSRGILSTLDGGGHVHLDVLPSAQALTLLADQVGRDRIAAEPSAAAAVVEMCARVPLALRLAGARLVARPSWSVATLAARLEDEDRRLGELAAGDRAVRAGFAVGHQALAASEDPVDRAAARMFRLLGAVSWVDVSVPAAAALLATDHDAATHALERLVDVRLLDSPRPGRYHTHDLLRLYARELAQAGDRPPDDALDRLLRCYIDAAGRANLLVNPISRHRPDGVDGPHSGFTIGTESEARAWVADEHQNLMAVAGQALDATDSAAGLAVALTAALNRPFDLLGHWPEFGAAREHAARTAHRLGDVVAAAFAWTDVGWGSVRMGRAEQAMTCARQALSVWREVGDRRSEQACLNILGYALRQVGLLAEAAESLLSAYAICEEIEHRYGQAATLNHLGLVHQRRSRFAAAVDCHSRAHALNVELDDGSGQAVSLANLGWSHLRAGRPDEAVAFFHRSLARARDVGDRYQEGETLWGLGDARRALGDLRRARAFWDRSLDLLVEIGGLSPAQADARRRQPAPDPPDVIVHNT